ncbi:MAG: type IX secretion system membrane protein PorP/SprF [Cyclobacteriaceae bacterium]
MAIERIRLLSLGWRQIRVLSVDRISWLLVVILVIASNKVFAQDPQFSQYYAAPMYLNPALVGINQEGRAGINYRNQWPSMMANFETYSFYFDYNFIEHASSVGLIVNQDQEGLIGLKTTNIGAQYAYQVDLNHRWTFRPAVEAGYYWRSIDFTHLTFPDQFDDTGLINPTTIENLGQGQARWFDLSFGGIIFNKNAWFGGSAHHVLEPNQSIAGGDVLLRKKVSYHGGYKIPLDRFNPFMQSKLGREWSMTPTFNYKTQGDFDQLDLGVYFTFEPILTGLWYRGIPLKMLEEIPNSEAIVLMFGLRMGQTMFGYSFDFTLSDLGVSSGGAHEISLIYSFRLGDKSKPSMEIRGLKCPIPYNF